MSGIKDLHGLLFWMDNTKGSSMGKVLSDQRNLSHRKRSLLRELSFEKNLKLPGKEPGLGPVAPDR